MIDLLKKPRLVGNYIRQRREALGLSQRALGLLFDPPVTTQFISNVERGVTPLPPAHVPTLSKALTIAESEIMTLLEREYALKLTGRLKKSDGISLDPPGASDSVRNLSIEQADYDFMRSLYDSFRQSDPKTRAAFFTVCETLLKVAKSTVR